MPKMEVNLDEMLTLIAKQQIIIERQNKALEDITEMYNQKMEENEKLKSGGARVLEMERTN